VVEKDGVRILEHVQPNDRTQQFLLSTNPSVAPDEIIKSVKGRLQHSIRREAPKSFKRNYAITSVGPAKGDVVEQYVQSQLQHHEMADEKVQQRLLSYQIHNPEIDLNATRRSSHGEFIYNLHLVMAHQDRWKETREDVL